MVYFTKGGFETEENTQEEFFHTFNVTHGECSSGKIHLMQFIAYEI